MIKAEEAYSILSKKEPDRSILSCVDYKGHWVFAAPEGDNDYNSPFFAVDKKTGKVSYFNPADDFISWFKAVDNNSIDIDSLKHSADWMEHISSMFDGFY